MRWQGSTFDLNHTCLGMSNMLCSCERGAWGLRAISMSHGLEGRKQQEAWWLLTSIFLHHEEESKEPDGFNDSSVADGVYFGMCRKKQNVAHPPARCSQDRVTHCKPVGPSLTQRCSVVDHDASPCNAMSHHTATIAVCRANGSAELCYLPD